MEKKITPEKITDLKRNEVFVFGSNEAGFHGAGAADFARKWGARMGCGFGKMGYTFAIPTKDWNIQTLPLSVVAMYVDRFNAYLLQGRYARSWKFYITKIGCGLAGFTVEEIAPLFKPIMHLPNVYLPQEFWDVLQPDSSQ